MDGVAGRPQIVDLFKMYMWISIVVFVCMVVIYVVAPETFIIG